MALGYLNPCNSDREATRIVNHRHARITKNINQQIYGSQTPKSCPNVAEMLKYATLEIPENRCARRWCSFVHERRQKHLKHLQVHIHESVGCRLHTP